MKSQGISDSQKPVITNINEDILVGGGQESLQPHERCEWKDDSKARNGQQEEKNFYDGQKY